MERSSACDDTPRESEKDMLPSTAGAVASNRVFFSSTELWEGGNAEKSTPRGGASNATTPGGAFGSPLSAIASGGDENQSSSFRLVGASMENSTLKTRFNYFD